ncbi:double-strand break repair protein MRE11 [Acrasis kona]|uniref:Double-strand break repair protein MRE11 n=1 Tax=Acrasis kona TaxID=1008807 RepID=A0AAW2YVY6_9EUKA
MIATDNHLGYAERDRIRRDDSFVTFEEILCTAKERNVDFLLLGGDLFHDNKPSRETLHRTLKMFREYVLGDKPVPLCVQSNQKVNFKDNFGTVNYEDPNFNVSLPVFAIHGNHDDPTGENGLSAMDLLSVSNLINYFGKVESVDNIQVKPILINKGCTKLALYGLGNIRDERLYQTFKQKNVKFFRPIGDNTAATSEWFNLFVLHQNRAQHNKKVYHQRFHASWIL